MENLKNQCDNELLAKAIEYNKQKFLAFKNEKPFTINKDLEKVLNSRYQKISRIKRRLLYLIIRYKYIWFCTFSINPEMYSKSERTRRNFLKKYLYSHDFKIILNTDWGTEGTERMHYHVILATNIDMDINQYFQTYFNEDFGWCKSLPCLKGNDDFKRLSKYINKLANHCVKASTQNKRMLYNFKGYDLFVKDARERTVQYRLEKWYFESVSLLDKADTTGKILLDINQ